MSLFKTQKEIEIMTECGKRLRAVTDELMPSISPGETTIQVDARATRLIRDNGLDISFTTVKGYKHATCLPVNHQAVHTPPSNYILRPGDVLTVDIGGLYKGYHTDWATTIVVGGVRDIKKDAFLKAGKEALSKTLSALEVGKHLGIVGKVMQDTIEGEGYKVMKDLTGHGIGSELHEDPYIPNYLYKQIDKTPIIKPGFVAAIEIIYSESTEKIVQNNPDGWSIDTSDGSLAACFEHTITIDQNGVHILT